jgi:hypothetical protein
MKNELLLFVVVGAFFGYFLLGYVKNSEGQKDDTIFVDAGSKYNTSLEKKSGTYKHNIDLSTTEEWRQADKWQQSYLHEEFMRLFPDFEAMREFANNNIIGDSFKAKLIANIDRVENPFYANEIDKNEALKGLDEF